MKRSEHTPTYSEAIVIDHDEDAPKVYKYSGQIAYGVDRYDAERGMACAIVCRDDEEAIDRVISIDLCEAQIEIKVCKS